MGSAVHAEESARAAAQHFRFDGKPVSCEINQNGHINDTLIISTNGESGKRYILQRINTKVFLHPDELMENIVGVTTFLKKKIEEAGGDPARETLSVIPAEDGTSMYRDPSGRCWRAYLFIEGTVCYDRPDLPERFGQSGGIFGHFQKQLSEYPAETLHETIPGFHNTPGRYREFEQIVQSDPLHRAAGVEEEIRFLESRRGLSERLLGTHMPLRVVHNDTKLSNVLFDRRTGRALCVIDLDTIMPGYVVTDFGDAIRFGASTAAEDEPDLNRVHFDRRLYDLFLDAFLREAGEALTKEEICMLPAGAEVITYEQALRFLTDYLAGDVYYHTERPHQNLDRTRTQIRLLQEMEENLQLS